MKLRIGLSSSLAMFSTLASAGTIKYPTATFESASATSEWAYSATSLAACTHPAIPASSPICTEENMFVRKEWSCFSDDEKLDYIRSVKCMMYDRPSKLPPGAAPGARSRYDDFHITHINLTLSIHVDGSFIPFHRRYLFLFEEALRTECSYKGRLPYMYWPHYAANMTTSSIFDGSETSLGGDGYFNASNPSLSNGNYTPPPSYGGGCVHTGPFANWTLHFRNFPPIGSISVLPADTLDYNPHCLRRNLNSALLQNSNSEEEIRTLLAQPNIVNFLHRMDHVFYPDDAGSPNYGTHAGAHGAVGGDMTDFFASAGDPVFWLHHSMIDNLWTQWQAVDPPNRQFAINGTDRLLNPPNATIVNMDYEQSFGYLDHPWRLGDLMDVTKGPFCYRYE